MKRKSLTIVLFVAVVLAFTLTPVKSFALEQGWHYARIVNAGPLFGYMVIMVNSTPDNTVQFIGQWLELNPAMQSSLLATALSAISMQQTVRIWVMNNPHSLPGLPIVQTCYSLLLVD